MIFGIAGAIAGFLLAAVAGAHSGLTLVIAAITGAMIGARLHWISWR